LLFPEASKEIPSGARLCPVRFVPSFLKIRK
jgi:hypothetical protein